MQKDMRGMRIGSLIVARELPADANRRRRWLCRCDCGGEIIINSAQLRRGRPDHCGCRKPTMRSDLAGQTFGKLSVIGPSDRRGPRGKRTVPLWECRCECGAICYKATDTLTNSAQSMCAKCADKLHTAKARAYAGFAGGTQVSKIRSAKMSRANTSGVRGVSLDKRSRKWLAQIGFKGQRIKLGYYARFEEAVKARKRAEEELFGAFLEEYESTE